MLNTNLIRVRKGRWAIYLTQECDESMILAALDLLDRESAACGTEHPDGPGVWRVHSGGRSDIYGVEVPGKKYCVKVFTDSRILNRVRTFLGWAKGRRAFKNGLYARECNVPVPQVYAYAEKPFGPTLVVMEFLENANQMNLLLEERLAQGIELTADPFFLQLIETFAGFTRGLHAKGVSHSDFSPRNVLVLDDYNGPSMRLIDLEDLNFSNKEGLFREDIEHFNCKMTRYVDDAAMDIFLNKFREYYGKG